MILHEELEEALKNMLPFKIVTDNGREYEVHNVREIHTCLGAGHVVHVRETLPLIPAVISLSAISALEHIASGHPGTSKPVDKGQ
jgi:hypothetical protein